MLAETPNIEITHAHAGRCRSHSTDYTSIHSYAGANAISIVSISQNLIFQLHPDSISNIHGQISLTRIPESCSHNAWHSISATSIFFRVMIQISMGENIYA